MAGKGPPPIPTRLKILRGNPGHQKLNKHEPQAPLGRPARPRWLNQEAAREWKRITKELDAMGLLARADRAVIAAYCQTWARWRQAEEAIEEKGLSRQNHRLAEANLSISLLSHLRAFAQELGLSPSARSRIVVEPRKKQTLSAIEEMIG